MSCIVVLELRIRPDSVAEMRSYLAEILPQTRGYAGCIHLDVYADPEDDTRIVFHERWESRAHYERYFAWRSETGVAARLGSMMDGAPRLQYLEQLAM